jgi:hypothetical protein
LEGETQEMLMTRIKKKLDGIRKGLSDLNRRSLIDLLSERRVNRKNNKGYQK